MSMTSHFASARLVYPMLRVGDLAVSLDFYCGKLGMRLLRRDDYPTGRFTLAFVGYDGAPETTIELTHNWDERSYDHGSGFGHIAIGVDDVAASCAALAGAGVTVLRAPGPMLHVAQGKAQAETIAFLADPDGYRIELVHRDAH